MEVERRFDLVSLVERWEAIQTRARGPRFVRISVEKNIVNRCYLGGGLGKERREIGASKSLKLDGERVLCWRRDERWRVRIEICRELARRKGQSRGI